MKNTFGKLVTVTLFGESHGSAVGAVLDGVAAGIPVNEDYISEQLSLRRPQDALSTARAEVDEFVIHSGIAGGKTTGSPICIIIPNREARSSDYENAGAVCRPSHADYTAHCRFSGFADMHGGGHFSGRITAALVAAGAILRLALDNMGIKIISHISEIAGIKDREFSDIAEDGKALEGKQFAVLCDEAKEKMIREILSAKEQGDSVGGVIQTAVTGIPAGVGEPWFDTVEGILSHALFSIPAVKGVEFGAGFGITAMRGSEANDAFRIVDGKVVTKTNHSGGIQGGITNGMPIIFRIAIKPTPTISKKQETIDVKSMKNIELEAKGRHDPCIVHRARVVSDSVTAIVLCDMLAERYGTDWYKV